MKCDAVAFAVEHNGSIFAILKKGLAVTASDFIVI